MPYYDVEKINEALESALPELLTQWFPEGKFMGNAFKVGSLDGERGTSLSIAVKGPSAGRWLDRASGERGNAIQLYMRKEGVNGFSEAVEKLAQEFQIAPEKAINTTQKPYSPPSKKTRPIQESDDAFKYLSARGLGDLKLLHGYDVRVTEKGELVYRHFDQNGKPCLEKYIEFDLEKGQRKGMYSNSSPRHTLFGSNYTNPDLTQGVLYLTEGQEDALTATLMGFPANSIPSGVDNFDWIEADYEYLKGFHTIVICFDWDEAGQRAKQIVLDRLGYSKCRTIDTPSTKAKDLNELLRKGMKQTIVKLLSSPMVPSPDELVRINQYASDVYKLATTNIATVGTVGPLNGKLRYRFHEATLYTGRTSSGKSAYVGNVIINQLHQIGDPAMIFSMEQPPKNTIADYMRMIGGRQINIMEPKKFKKIYDYLSELLIIYKSTRSANPQTIIDYLKYGYERHGCVHFVVDNVATLEVSRDDYGAQQKVIDGFRTFVNDYPVHLHLVAHPRKAPSGSKNPIPEIDDVRGASEWCDLSHNIEAVWRNYEKDEKIKELVEQAQRENRYLDPAKLKSIQNSIPDAVIKTLKQRFNGVVGTTAAWFDSHSKRYTNNPEIEKVPHQLPANIPSPSDGADAKQKQPE